jgi:beta-phosphoglucomutase-like phosphatase (HAD superfamily)
MDRTNAMPCLGESASRFNAIITGDEVTHGKPAPDIYLLAARKLGVELSQCPVLEDSENGARSALAVGMSVVIVPDLVQPPSEIKAKAHQVCESLHEVLALVTRQI